jgi:hypothetical protein
MQNSVASALQSVEIPKGNGLTITSVAPGAVTIALIPVVRDVDQTCGAASTR